MVPSVIAGTGRSRRPQDWLGSDTALFAGGSVSPSSAAFSRTSVSVRLRKVATCATVRPCSSLLLRENRSFLDHSLPLLEVRLFGHAIQPNSRALSLASFQASVRNYAKVIETRLSSFLG